MNMKMIQLSRYGEALEDGLFQSIDVPKPNIKAGYVLIRVLATSINPLDYKIRSGMLGHAGPALPAVLHCDVAGIVEEVGKDVNRFKVGDKVYGCAGGVTGRPGALAEYMLAQESLLAHAPTSIPLETSAALPLVAITAWEGLVKYARLQPGARVLVFGGTGGIGHIAIQLAKQLGATVVATAGSQQKVEIAKQLGAHEVINYKENNVIDFVNEYTKNKGFDVVFDTVGASNLDISMQTVAMNGQLITTWVQGPVDLLPLLIKGATLHFTFMPNPMLTNIGCEIHGEILEKIAKLVDQNKLKPFIDQQQFSFADVAQAHHYAETKQNLGKILLQRKEGMEIS